MQIYQMQMSQLERKKMGIYVCLSDGGRKPFAPSGDTQGQRGIDEVNSEWQGAEIQLWLFVCVLAFSLSLSVTLYLFLTLSLL